MFNKELIESIGKSYPERVKDIGESLGLVNIVIDELLGNINEDVTKALDDRNHERATNYIDMHSKICEIYDKNINLIASLETNEKEEDVIEQTDEEEKRVIPDYNKYVVDHTIPHALYEDFEFKRPISFKLKDNEMKVSTWIDVFLLTCEILCKIDSQIFKSFIYDKNMNGRKKSYFSVSKNNIRKPRKLECADIYIESNLSANSIKQIIIKMLRKYNIKITDYIVYFRADYTELNKNNGGLK
ncbi:hypothetical protein [uncultured Clostridium sp.]|uniref:hypothetical protein n=1 Tax=uncultured Clostridium sp. TaxID=59620 RepID=UPI0028E72EDA|nr:hypothetical protein [uncultured Clostridium sp.]